MNIEKICMDIGKIIDPVNGKKIGKAIGKVVEATMPIIIANAMAEEDSQTGMEKQQTPVGFIVHTDNEKTNKREEVI
jgi:hypothetical protein